MYVVLIVAFLLGSIGIGVPIAFALALISIGILFFADMSMMVVVQRVYAGVNSFPLLAVPFFILAGQIMNHSGISARLMEFAQALVGSLRGGLAHVNVVTSMFFAGMSGTAMSDSAAVGGILVPAMIKRGYSRAFTGAVTASASTIGIIIPPSVPMVLLGAFMGVSTGALFAAGFVPGIMIGLGMMVVAWFISRRRGYPVEDTFRFSTALRTMVKALPALAMPGVILGGILGGVFTPTEASAVAVIYGIGIGTFYYRTLTIAKLYRAFTETALLCGGVMLVTATAHVLGYAFTYEQVSDRVIEPLTSLASSGTAVLLILSVVMIICGVFLDGIAMMYIIVPLFLPAMVQLKIDPVVFGMVVVLCWGIGQQTPPVAAALYITSMLAKCDVVSITRENIPFIGVMVVVLLLLIAFPQTLVLAVPRLMGF